MVLGNLRRRLYAKNSKKLSAVKRTFFIQFPYTINEVQDAIDNFEEEYKFPQIVGAIDGSYIEINVPLENKEDYFNRKQYYSVNL